jgi:hypothetical protein
VHLVNLQLFMKSSMGPFSRWVLHGDRYEEAGLGLDPAMFSSDPPFPAGCWVIAAMKGSLATGPSATLMELALGGFADYQLCFDSIFLLQVLDECVLRCLDGALSVLLRSPHIRNSVKDKLPLFFSEASRVDAVEVMRVIWKSYVEDREDYESVKNEVRDRSFRSRLAVTDSKGNKVPPSPRKRHDSSPLRRGSQRRDRGRVSP